MIRTAFLENISVTICAESLREVLLADVSGHDYLVKAPEDDVVNLHWI